MIISRKGRASESRPRSSSVISISSDDDTPPSKRKRSANTTPQPETPSKKLATRIDSIALIDEGLQPKDNSLGNVQLERPRDISLPPIETYRLKSAAILKMLYADEAPAISKNDTMGSKESPGISTVTPSPKCYWHPDGKGYVSLSDSNDDEDPEEAGGYGNHSDDFVQPTIENQIKIDMVKSMHGSPVEGSPEITPETPNEISKPYKCEKCGSRWKAEASLKHHLTKSLTTCNPNWDPSQADPRGRPRIHNLSDLKCEKCGFQFRTEPSYKYHITKCQTTRNPHWDSSQAKTSEPPSMSEPSTPSMLEQAEYKSPYVNERPSYAEYVSQCDRQARPPTLAPKPIPPSPGPIIDLTLTPHVSGPASNPTPVAPVHEPIQTQTPQSTPPVAHDALQKSA